MLAAISENVSLSKLANRIDEMLFSEKDPSKGGRPRFKTETMLKILILKWLYNLSYVNVIDHIKVNLAFQFFIGMTSGFPDDHTVNDFNTLLSEHFVMDELFEIQLGIMRDEGMVKADTVIIDSSMVEVDRPRNTKEEDEAIKEGKVPEEWKKETNRKKKAQKDMDARATFKHGRSYFGYKNHLAIDAESKVIVSSKTTPASVHDSQVCKDLIDKEAKQVYGDSAYVGEPIAKELKEKCGNGVILHMNNRAYRNRALTAEEKETNRECSRIRARLEHIFGWMKMLFKKTKVQSIGLK